MTGAPIVPEDADVAYDLINAIIAVYSSRIGLAEPAEAARLRAARAPYILERQNLDPYDLDRTRTILTEYPAVLAAVRAGR